MIRSPHLPPAGPRRGGSPRFGFLVAVGLAAFALPAPTSLVAQDAGANREAEIRPFPLHPPEVQIRLAVQALPEALRDGAAVMGYREEGALATELRAGSGDFVCLLSPPGVWVVESACYHHSMEPFMARGRELAHQGVSGAERVEIRNREAEEGVIPLPTDPAALHILLAPVEGVDPATGEFTDSFARSVIYVPFATGSETGLSERPVPGAPWLMDAGSPRAHIMFSPSMQLPEPLQRAMQRGR